MAIEYLFLGSQDLSNNELLEFFADAVDGSVVNGDYVERDGLFIIPRHDDSGDQTYITDIFGFVPRIAVTFRFWNLASREVAKANTVTMIRATLLLLHKYQGKGVLLFNYEEVVLQKLNGGVVVNNEWEELAELPELRELVKTRELRPLPQPLLEPQTGES
jgi:hypothetical protein